MATDSQSTALHWLEQSDGALVLLPADHAQRVTALSLGLYDAPSARDGRRLLFDVKTDQTLSREYGRVLMLAAIEQLFGSLLHHGSPVEVALIGSRLWEYIRCARAPLVGDDLSNGQSPHP